MRTKTPKARENPEAAALGYVKAALNSLRNAQRILPGPGNEHIHAGLAATVNNCCELIGDFYKYYK